MKNYEIYVHTVGITASIVCEIFIFFCTRKYITIIQNNKTFNQTICINFIVYELITLFEVILGNSLIKSKNQNNIINLYMNSSIDTQYIIICCKKIVKTKQNKT